MFGFTSLKLSDVCIKASVKFVFNCDIYVVIYMYIKPTTLIFVSYLIRTINFEPQTEKTKKDVC